MVAWIARLAATALLFPCIGQGAEATSLRASPTSLQLIAPAGATTIRLRNEATKPLHVQVRVFRWTQHNGVERLEPTNDVVASPPSTRLDPDADYLVRIVRVGKQPVAQEESYRVVVDEVPLRSGRRPGAVNLVVRHAIPLFVCNADVSLPDISWSWSRSGSGIVLTARNSGGSRLKVYDLTLTQNGRRIARRAGLVGYVLAGSTVTFALDKVNVHSGGSVSIEAHNDLGRFNATAVQDRK